MRTPSSASLKTTNLFCVTATRDTCIETNSACPRAREIAGLLLAASPTSVAQTKKLLLNFERAAIRAELEVAIEVSARVFSSLPTRVLAKALGREVSAKGTSRTVASVDGLSEAVGKVSGVMVSPDVWAGLDRSPNADATFLAKLEQRLEWQALGAGSLEKDGLLEWRAWQVTADGARWRRASEGRLWWARTWFGGHHRAWTAGASPATSAFITLSPDDSDRARFALSREVALASLLRVERFGKRVTIEVPGWLPRSEYRWLSLHAAPVADGKGLRWEISADAEAQVTKVLTERLGLVVEAR